MKAGLLVAAGLLALLVTRVGHAADEVEAPKVHKQGGTTYVTGGSGDEQHKAFARIANKYPIQLIFAVDGDPAGVSGVKVTLTDLSGNALIEAVSEGPFFFINPPAGGRFAIDVEYNGDKQTVTNDLVGRRYLVLNFKFRAP